MARAANQALLSCKIACLAGVLLWISGCQDTRQDGLEVAETLHPVHESKNAKIPSDSKAASLGIPLSYQPMNVEKGEIKKTIQPSAKLVLQEVSLKSGSVLLYRQADAQPDDSSYDAGIVKDGAFYALGEIGYGSPDGVAVQERPWNGIPLIVVEGFMGASAPLTLMVAMDEAVPRVYLKLEQAIQFTDADGDGEDELVASEGGTVPNTSLIAATTDGEFMTAKLNDVLGTIVFYDNSQHVFVASTGTNQTERYKLQAGELVKLR